MPDTHILEHKMGIFETTNEFYILGSYIYLNCTAMKDLQRNCDFQNFGKRQGIEVTLDAMIY